MTFLSRFEPQLLSIFRIMAALLILQHGTTKILDFPAGPMNDVPLLKPSGIAGFFELIFGVLLAIGLFSRLSVAAGVILPRSAVWKFPS